MDGTTVLAVGIDIGGTKIAGGVVDADGTIVRRARVATPTDVTGIEIAVSEMITELSAGQRLPAKTGH